MCGISGIINKKNQGVSLQEIRKINDLIAHRGPDGEGFFFGTNFAFGHKRLSVIDLSERGDQPMDYSGKYKITYNGEIYNYLELKLELKRLGYYFNSESDTEVLLAAYDHYGTDCVKHFNGMWAFAIFDEQKRIIFCSRDRFGVKPFYYTDTGDKFIFGSEIKQILPYSSQNKVNIPVLMDYLIIGIEDYSNATFFHDVYKLEQSHNLIYELDRHVFSISRYYEINIDYNLSGLNEKESVLLFKEGLENSISLRLRSDVKVGTCLSGGLDSSSIAAIGSNIYQRNSADRFNAVTAISTESETNEKQFAELVARKAGLNWHITVPGSSDFYENIDKIIKIQEEPFSSPSVFMQYKVFEMAKKLGCIVMLDGQGGDETLLGYERYYPAYLKSLTFRELLSGFLTSSGNSNLSKRELLKYYFYFTMPSVRINHLRKRFSFINKEYLDQINKPVLSQLSKSYNDILLLQKLELMQIQLPHLLKYEDRNSMHHSIEARLPFIDYHLVETALSINNKFKVKDGWSKYLLRRSIEGVVPEQIVWRKSKIGFNAPEKTWLLFISDLMKKQIEKSVLLEIISDRKFILLNFAKIDLRSQWRLFNIARWEELFNITLGQ